MSKKRKTYTENFKAKVALEAVKGVKTLAEIASEYKIHPTQVTEWKKHLITEASGLFSGKKSSRTKTEEELTAPLYEEIGRLKMDLKWLEKKL